MQTMIMTLLLTCLMVAAPFPFPAPHPCAQPWQAAPLAEPAEIRSGWATGTVHLTTGYRIDDLKWSIAGNRLGGHPNILSEVGWSDVQSPQLKLMGHATIKDRVYLKGRLDYGMVVSGNNQDSDFRGDNRTGEFSRSENGVDGNSVWDGSLGAGPRFSFLASSIVLCPMLGYAIAEQDFNIIDGYQALATPPATISTGPIEGLDSRYQTRWHGPWIGMDLLFSIPLEKGPFHAVEILFSGEYHWVDYTADANWNLRTDLQHPVSFSHDAEGNGLVVGTTIVFQSGRRWAFNLGMNIVDMETDPGLDRVYHADGSVSETSLNKVEWRAMAFEAGLSYRF